MPFKYNEDGTQIVLQETIIGGNAVKLPVFIHPDGKELPFDADITLTAIGTRNREAQQHREAKEAAEGRLRAFEGIEPEAAKKALALTKDLDETKLVAAGKVDEVRVAATKAMQERMDAQQASFAEVDKTQKTRISELEGSLHNEIVGGNFARSKYIAEKLAIPADIAQAQFGRAFKIENNRLVAYDADGQRIGSQLRPGDLNPDFDEALERLVDKYPNKAAILKGSNANGGGANQGGQGGGGKNTITRAAYEALPMEQRGVVLKDKQLVD